MTYSDQFSRSELLYGTHAIKRLKASRVAVFGLGGVGGICAWALVRSGLGFLLLCDGDVVSPSNLNRQIIASNSRMGMAKVHAARQLFSDINTECLFDLRESYLDENNIDEFPLQNFDYVIDAIDDIGAKVMLAETCSRLQVPLISSMGAGNRKDPRKVCIADIFETRVCPLAKRMRKELRKRNISHLKVVYSVEEPSSAFQVDNSDEEKLESFLGNCADYSADTMKFRSSAPKRSKAPIASNVLVPSAMGLALAYEVIEYLIAIEKN